MNTVWGHTLLYDPTQCGTVMFMSVKELYFSVDVEADGPIPGPYSMTAFGAVLCGSRTSDGVVEKFDVTAPENRFYRELCPISEDWDPEAMSVGVFVGFDTAAAAANPDPAARREYILENGVDPVEGMSDFAVWVTGLKKTHGAQSVVFAAYPLGFDWMFTYWYLMKFSRTGSPFGFSNHVDMKTLYSAYADALIKQSTKRFMPRHLHTKIPHTHLAIDDAAGQGELFMNLLEWGKQ